MVTLPMMVVQDGGGTNSENPSRLRTSPCSVVIYEHIALFNSMPLHFKIFQCSWMFFYHYQNTTSCWQFYANTPFMWMSGQAQITDTRKHYLGFVGEETLILRWKVISHCNVYESYAIEYRINSIWLLNEPSLVPEVSPVIDISVEALKQEKTTHPGFLFQMISFSFYVWHLITIATC